MIASLTFAVATAHGIGPDDFDPAGPVGNDKTNSEFLLAVANLSAQFHDTAPTETAGDTFAGAHGLPTTIPGYGGKVAVRIWFMSAESAYTNAFGVRIGSDQQLVFGDVGSQKFGDYVDLNGGAIIDPALHFFALTNIIGGEAKHFYADAAMPGKKLSKDKVEHLNINYRGEFAHAGSLWFALALDDQHGGGDRDWNDYRLAIQLHPVVTPEPATIALCLGFLAVGAWLWRRQRFALA
ncbi:MAG TPA: hypothetical protein VEL07_18085 [Planctomycetota bacterium]|nr:hypothetical protein [Planctomycetota bacterium]